MCVIVANIIARTAACWHCGGEQRRMLPPVCRQRGFNDATSMRKLSKTVGKIMPRRFVGLAIGFVQVCWRTLSVCACIADVECASNVRRLRAGVIYQITCIGVPLGRVFI